jgi:hypothetical protein
MTALTLDSGFAATVDAIDEADWYRTVDQFYDASLYQTWAYDVSRFGKNKISHLLLYDGSEVVAAAQVRIVRLPVVGHGAGYVRWGPVWQKRGRDKNSRYFRLALRALREEYVTRRGLFLRIFPPVYEGDPDVAGILQEERFVPTPDEDRGRTLIVDIDPPLSEIRAKLDKKWRNCLNKAEQNDLKVVEGTEDELFAEFIEIYRQLVERKKFATPNEINQFRMIQRALPHEFKMRIFVCRSQGVPAAGAICTAIGRTGVYLFGATSSLGMTNKASYLVQWAALQWLKQAGCTFYNLNGINPHKNPGTYHFKAGLAHKSGIDVHYLGRFDCYSSAAAAKLAHTAERILPLIHRVRAAFAG